MDRELPGHGAGRRGGADHPVELPAADAGLEDRAGARRWATRWCSSRPSSPRSPRCCSPSCARRRGCPPAWSTSSPATGAPAPRWSAHPGVDKIAFTGSTEVGRIIREATAGTGKKLSLELGGKSPFIVFDDADLDSVVEGVVDAIWFNQGQVCCAGSRLLVQEGIAARLDGEAQGPDGDAPHRRPARQGGRHRRDRRPGAAREDPGAGHARARRRAPGCWQPVVELPDRGLLLPAHALHRRGAGRDGGAGGDLRAGAGDDDASARRPRRWSWPTTPATASPPASGPRTSTSRSTSRRS